MNYTQDQLKALQAINNFISNKSQTAFLLNGCAGVGKTSIVSKITQDQYLNAKRSVVGAFTNKATNVIGKKCPYASKMTLFRLLSLKAQEDSETLQFQISFNDKKENNISLFDLIVIDECSQLENEHVNLLLEKATEYRKKIIFVGDSFQLPPINNDSEISCSFDIQPSYELTEIVRQAKNSNIPIYASYFRDIISKVSDGIKIPIETKIEYPECEDLHFYNTSDRFIESMLKDFNSDEYKMNSDYVKVIGYRNNTINKVNDLVRKSMFGSDIEPLMIGEKLILNSPGYHHEFISIPDYETSDEIQILDIIEKKIYDSEHYGVKITFPYCQAHVRRCDDSKDSEMNIVYPAFKDKFEEMTKQWAKRISGQKRIFKDEWYPFIKKFNCPSYAYAITSHKSQGDSIEHVYMLEDDVDQVKKSDLLTLFKSKYVTISRASKQLHILNRIKGRPLWHSKK